MLQMERNVRRTQAERSDRTRKLLHEATISLLIDVGYSNTTSSEIAKRAGVSRGAQTHHYPEKIDLIIASTQSMFSEFADGLDVLAEEVRSGRMSVDELFEKTWAEMLDGNWFYASLEIIVAARGDTELQQRLQPAIRALHDQFNAIWRRTFEARNGDCADVAITMNLVLNVLRGMAVQAVLRPDKTYLQNMLFSVIDIVNERVRPIQG